jgi:serum/glucocorticoid-regulated kinase 2
MSEPAKDIITRLLDKSPNNRLGVNGVEEIKQHEFFKGLDWNDVLKKKLTPPFVFEVKGIEDVSNFYKVR